MAVVNKSLKDTGQASVKKGTGILRISSVTDTGAILGGAETDPVGNSGGSAYELQYKRTSTFADEAEMETLIDESGEPIGFREGDRSVTIEGEMFGQVGDELMAILFSVRNGYPFWRVVDYEWEEGNEYVRREFWKGYFDPKLISNRGASQDSVTPFRIIFLQADGALSNSVGKKFYSFADDDAAVPALASEVWTTLGS